MWDDFHSKSMLKPAKPKVSSNKYNRFARGTWQETEQLDHAEQSINYSLQSIVYSKLVIIISTYRVSLLESYM